MNRRDFTLAGLGAATLAGLGLAGNANGAEDKPMTSFPVQKTPEEWKRILTPQQYYVLREHGTERAFTSPLNHVSEPGTFKCAGCGQSLFKYETKYDSGTGWPSFYKPIDGAVGTSVDRKFFMVRTEVHCSNCGGHLGHVFDDGPPPTGLRYCMNGVAMVFEPATEKAPS